MKLRIHANSIRLRLTKTEIARFAAEGQVEGVLTYGDGVSERLNYGIRSSLSAATLSLDVAPNRVVILVPASQAAEWVQSERISVEGVCQIKSGPELRILVEKEFRRLHGATADPDLYPNPLESSLHK